MTYWKDKISLAKRALGGSVVSINPNLRKEDVPQQCDMLSFGIKDTKQIPEEVIKCLENNLNMRWLTIDKASDKGRAIDTDLHNPITYRLMTGSTSGGPINILKGINDVAIGTDGGGSVLAPAMSCQLPSFIGAGLGLHVNQRKRSTDGREFIGSVGVIAKNITSLMHLMECLADDDLHVDTRRTLKIAIPKRGSVSCPDQKDMGEKVMKYLNRMDDGTYKLEELDMDGTDDRGNGIAFIQRAFEQYQADIIVTHEGPVDVYGYGETIPQGFGDVGREIARNHGKYLVRAANMCQTTAITVPTEDISSGIVIIAKNGIKNAGYAFQLAKEFEKVIQLPEVWKRYFLEEQHNDGRDLN